MIAYFPALPVTECVPHYISHDDPKTQGSVKGLILKRCHKLVGPGNKLSLLEDVKARGIVDPLLGEWMPFELSGSAEKPVAEHFQVRVGGERWMCCQELKLEAAPYPLYGPDEKLKPLTERYEHEHCRTLEDCLSKFTTQDPEIAHGRTWVEDWFRYPLF